MNTKEKEQKEFVMLLAVAFAALVLLATMSSFVSADAWTCFQNGQKANFCNPNVPDRTAPPNGKSLVCMKEFNVSGQCYSQGSDGKCNTVPALPCGNGPNTTWDFEPPSFDITNPQDKNIFSFRSIDLKLNASEFSDFYLLDLNARNARWTRLCNECLSMSRRRSFKEGWNNVSFRAEDVMGNEAFKNVSFFIDSRKPRILSMEPRRGFASGLFNVQFKEDNPSQLILTYGNNISGFSDHNLDISSECEYNDRSKKYICETFVDLNNYDGEEIQYWFNLTDIADVSDKKKPIKLDVDTTAPFINSLDHSINGRRVTLTFNISEENFGYIEYIDNSALRPRWIKVCTSLRSDMCIKTISLSSGSHDLDFRVFDKAGNMDEAELNLNI